MPYVPKYSLAVVLVALLAVSARGVVVPTSVSCSAGAVRVSMCDMDRDAYIKDTPATPMFRDQVRAHCKKQFTVGIDELHRQLDADNIPPANPAGFIFHMTRCGSTLIGNMLGSSKDITMYTESAPPADILNSRCQLSDEARISALRIIVRAMGRPTTGRNVVFKFQSALNVHNEFLRKAFPNTPWLFVHRDAKEVMSSNLRKGGSSPPCVRSQSHPPRTVLKILGVTASEVRELSREEYCAAYLAYLMGLGAWNIENSATPAGALDYTSLPGSVVDSVLPLFNLELDSAAKAKMMEVGGKYSKSRKRGGVEFESDSERKQEQARGAIAKFAEKYTSSPAKKLQARELSRSNVPLDLPTVVPHSVATGSLKVAQTDDSTDYPEWFPLGEILDWWNPDDATVPPDYDRYNSLARFDYQVDADRVKALQFRKAELPFILFNIPSLEKARSKWTDDYLNVQLSQKYGVEESFDNHFMYYNKGMARRSKTPSGWERPTEERHMTFAEWLKLANKRPLTNNDPHYYFRASSGSRHTKFIAQDLEYFNHRTKEGKMFVVDPSGQRGIHCRFGMEGVIAESHYDGGRNYVSMIRGRKRYILQPPSQCKNLKMLEYPHPSARHSGVDWSDRHSPYARHSRDKNVADAAFDSAASLHVVLKAGEALYIPSFWFHYIVSLETNIQCNSRSGTPEVGTMHINECGFRVSADSKETIAHDTRLEFRDAFREFNSATPAAQLKASHVPDSSKKAVPAAADDGGSFSDVVGSKLITSGAYNEAMHPTEEHEWGNMWMMTGFLAVLAVCSIVVAVLRFQRRNYLSHGGSV